MYVELQYFKLATELANFHFQEINDNEVSKLLGRPAIFLFYVLVLRSNSSKVFYSRTNDGVLLSLCCVFAEYQKFMRRLKLILLPILCWQYCANQKLRRVLNRRVASKVPWNELPNKESHLGMIVRSSKHSPASIFQLSKNIECGFEFLKHRNKDYVWASSSVSNYASVSFLERLGMSEFHRNAEVVTYLKALHS